jgi:hypothetical protein
VQPKELRKDRAEEDIVRLGERRREEDEREEDGDCKVGGVVV